MKIKIIFEDIPEKYFKNVEPSTMMIEYDNVEFDSFSLNNDTTAFLDALTGAAKKKITNVELNLYSDEGETLSCTSKISCIPKRKKDYN